MGSTDTSRKVLGTLLNVRGRRQQSNDKTVGLSACVTLSASHWHKTTVRVRVLGGVRVRCLGYFTIPFNAIFRLIMCVSFR